MEFFENLRKNFHENEGLVSQIFSPFFSAASRRNINLEKNFRHFASGNKYTHDYFLKNLGTGWGLNVTPWYGLCSFIFYDHNH